MNSDLASSLQDSAIGLNSPPSIPTDVTQDLSLEQAKFMVHVFTGCFPSNQFYQYDIANLPFPVEQLEKAFDVYIAALEKEPEEGIDLKDTQINIVKFWANDLARFHEIDDQHRALVDLITKHRYLLNYWFLNLGLKLFRWRHVKPLKYNTVFFEIGLTPLNIPLPERRLTRAEIAEKEQLTKTSLRIDLSTGEPEKTLSLDDARILVDEYIAFLDSRLKLVEDVDSLPHPKALLQRALTIVIDECVRKNEPAELHERTKDDKYRYYLDRLAFFQVIDPEDKLAVKNPYRPAKIPSFLYPFYAKYLPRIYKERVRSDPGTMSPSMSMDHLFSLSERIELRLSKMKNKLKGQIYELRWHCHQAVKKFSRK